jgi:hypothetical protein
VIETVLFIATLLQPSGLPGCGTIPLPACQSPDIPEIQWRPTEERPAYKWPLEGQGLSVTYHRNPAVYGALPTPSFGRREYCLIDEQARTAECWSEWEYQTVATCSLDRDRWIARTPRPAPQPALLYREDPLDYWFHSGRIQVYMWEWSQRFAAFPNVGAQSTPRPAVTFQADKTQVIRSGNTVFFNASAVLFIKENGSLFSGGFDYNAGGTDQLPANTSEGRACSSLYIGVTNWCDFAPFRPECQSPSARAARINQESK